MQLILEQKTYYQINCGQLIVAKNHVIMKITL